MFAAAKSIRRGAHPLASQNRRYSINLSFYLIIERQTTGTIRLKASFANDDERLWPGEFVNVRVILNIRKGVPTVPAQTVQDGPTGRYAYVIKDDSTVERRDVEVAVVQDGIAVVTKGLSVGEKVVVEGQYRLNKGARVRVSAPAPGAAG